MQTLRELCGLNTQGRGELILSALNSLGVDVTTQCFPGQARDYRNIIARIRSGSSEHQIALAAHYDKTDRGEGAIDNGAGVVELLYVLGKLNSDAAGYDVTFLFFDGEEDHCVGSRYFVENSDRGFRGVYNVDFAGVGDSVLLASSSYDSYTRRDVANDSELNRRVESVCRDKGLQAYHVDSPEADNVPFSLAGVPSTVIFTLPRQEAKEWSEGTKPWDLPTMKLINGEGDTFERVNPKTINMMTDVLLTLVHSYR